MNKEYELLRDLERSVRLFDRASPSRCLARFDGDASVFMCGEGVRAPRWRDADRWLEENVRPILRELKNARAALAATKEQP